MFRSALYVVVLLLAAVVTARSEILVVSFGDHES